MFFSRTNKLTNCKETESIGKKKNIVLNIKRIYEKKFMISET